MSWIVARDSGQPLYRFMSSLGKWHILQEDAHHFSNKEDADAVVNILQSLEREKRYQYWRYSTILV